MGFINKVELIKDDLKLFNSYELQLLKFISSITINDTGGFASMDRACRSTLNDTLQSAGEGAIFHGKDICPSNSQIPWEFGIYYKIIVGLARDRDYLLKEKEEKDKKFESLLIEYENLKINLNKFSLLD